MDMIAYHGKEEIKAFYLNRVAEHRKADQLIKGKYWEDGRGCAVGCCIHSSDHIAYETELGIPRLLAHLEDCIFENLPNKIAMTWPERFLAAIKPGADLSRVWASFTLWLIGNPEHGIIKHCRSDDKKAVKAVLVLLERQLGEDKPTYGEWSRARKECLEISRTALSAAAAAYTAAAAVAYTADAATAAAAATAATADAAAAATTADAFADAADATTAVAYATDAAAAFAAAAAAFAAAAATAAYTVAYATDTAAAYTAAAAAAAYTAASADAVAAYTAARSKHFVLMSEKLLELLEAA